MGYVFGIETIPPFLGAALVMFILFVFLKKRYRQGPMSTDNNLFFLLLLSLLIWDVGDGLLAASTDYATGMFWARLSNIGLVFLPALLLHFTIIYPIVKEGYRRYRYIYLVFFYTPAALFTIIIAFTKAFFDLVPGSEGVLWEYELRLFGSLFAIYFLAYMVGAIFMLYNSFKYIDDSDVKRQSKFMMTGLVSFLALIVFEGDISTLLHLPVNAIDSLVTFVLAVFFSIAAFRYNLMDLQILLEKSIAYSAISLSIAVMFVVVDEVLEYIIGGLFPDVNAMVSNIIAALIVSFTMDPLKDRIKSWADRIFEVSSFQ